MKKLKIIFIALFSFQSLAAQSPPDHQWIEVIVTPNHADWTYKIGEE